MEALVEAFQKSRTSYRLQLKHLRSLEVSPFFLVKVSIHSVWLGNNITPLREEEWGEDEDDEADAPAPTSPPLSPINSRSDKCTHLYFKFDA